jgi:hypothetical protein
LNELVKFSHSLSVFFFQKIVFEVAKLVEGGNVLTIFFFACLRRKSAKKKEEEEEREREREKWRRERRTKTKMRRKESSRRGLKREIVQSS